MGAVVDDGYRQCYSAAVRHMLGGPEQPGQVHPLDVHTERPAAQGLPGHRPQGCPQARAAPAASIWVAVQPSPRLATAASRLAVDPRLAA